MVGGANKRARAIRLRKFFILSSIIRTRTASFSLVFDEWIFFGESSFFDVSNYIKRKYGLQFFVNYNNIKVETFSVWTVFIEIRDLFGYRRKTLEADFSLGNCWKFSTHKLWVVLVLMHTISLLVSSHGKLLSLALVQLSTFNANVSQILTCRDLRCALMFIPIVNWSSEIARKKPMKIAKVYVKSRISLAVSFENVREN